MHTIALYFHNNGAKSGLKKPYLARLHLLDRGALDREFAKVDGKKNLRKFLIKARPGEIFEARRCKWTGDDYVNSTVWFGLQRDGNVFMLSRDEAMASLSSPADRRADALAALMAATPNLARMECSDIGVHDEDEPTAAPLSFDEIMARITALDEGRDPDAE